MPAIHRLSRCLALRRGQRGATVSRGNQCLVRASVAPRRSCALPNTEHMSALHERIEPGLDGGGAANTVGPRCTSEPLGSAFRIDQPVLAADALIERIGMGPSIRVLRVKLGFPLEVFAQAVRPLIHGYAEFVQLLPAVNSSRFGHCGGRLQAALVSALRAIERRRSQILPRGAPPEAIGVQAHRWSYAVFAAALLRELPHVSAGLRVWIDLQGVAQSWDPVSGSMLACGAHTYRVEALEASALDPVHSALALCLFESSVPTQIRNWLAEDALLMHELRSVLLGSADPGCAIAQLLVRSECTADPKPRPLPSAPPAPPVPRADTAVAADVSPAPMAPALEEPQFLAAVTQQAPAIAVQFMEWLKCGLQNGSLAVNRPDGVAYVVKEGLLLVSPRIFREFVKQHGAAWGGAVDAAKRVQREVLREGWHLRAEQGVNMQSYEVRASVPGAKPIGGIVLREPGRFIQSLPGVDETLVRRLGGSAVPI